MGSYTVKLNAGISDLLSASNQSSNSARKTPREESSYDYVLASGLAEAGRRTSLVVARYDQLHQYSFEPPYLGFSTVVTDKKGCAGERMEKKKSINNEFDF